MTISLNEANCIVTIKNYIPTIKRCKNLNETIIFSYNNSETNEGILSLLTSHIKIYDNNTETLWTKGNDHNWTLFSLGSGTYKLNVSTKGINSGRYVLNVNISNPFYDSIKFYVSFYLEGNSSRISVSSPKYTKEYQWYIGNDVDLELELIDLDNKNTKIDITNTEFTSTYINEKGDREFIKNTIL